MTPLSLLLNVLWLALGGLPAALGWVIAAGLMALTIIGLPFAWAHLKLAGASLAPVGTEVVERGTPYWC